jgi:small conductance mechanosensitive channel
MVKLQEKIYEISLELVTHLPKLLTALATLAIGFWIIKKLINFLRNKREGGRLQEVRPFLLSVLSILLKALLLISVAGMVGIETTSFVAIVAAAGFAVGFALQGSLANFASGVLILLFKPYRIGDYVQVADQVGYVEEIQIFNTIIRSVGNKTIIVPNSKATDGVITNMSDKPNIRVSFQVHIPYETSFENVKRILENRLITLEGVLREPKPFVGLEEFDTHSLKLSVWCYCLPESYWEVHYMARTEVKKALGEAKIKVAYSEGVELGAIHPE